MEKEKIIYFEVNDWFSERDYPDTEPFLTWMKDDLNLQFRNKDWVLENKLCIVEQIVDMSINFCVTATEEWVKSNCPCLLEEKYKKFLRFPNKNGIVTGRFEDEFLEYKPENFGITESIYEDGGILIEENNYEIDNYEDKVKRLNLEEIKVFNNENNSGLIFKWSCKQIGFGEYTLVYDKNKKCWKGESERMDSNKNKIMLKKLFDEFADKVFIVS